MIRFADETLLHQRHLLKRQLDTEVAARDHHGVGHGHDLVEVLEGRRLFDLRHELDRRGNEAAQLFDVLGTTHKREREVVHSDLHGVLDVLAILFGERRRRDVHTGEVHPLVRRQNPPVDHPAPHARRLDSRHLDRKQSVIQQDRRADTRVGGEAIIRGGQLVSPRDILGGKHHLLARRELARSREIPDANARSLEIEQDGDGQIGAGGDAADRRDPLGALLRSAVRGVDAQHVGTRLEQSADGRLIAGRRSERGDDLGAADGRDPVRRVIHNCTQRVRCGKVASLRLFADGSEGMTMRLSAGIKR